MKIIDRRTFVQITSGVVAAAYLPALETGSPQISQTNGGINVAGPEWTWRYRESDDSFELSDSSGRRIVRGIVQPKVVVAPVDHPEARLASAGKRVESKIESDRITFHYSGVNGIGTLSVTWRFDKQGIWMLPVIYECSTNADVISLHYFTESEPATPSPALHSSYFVVPGALSGSAISPVLEENVHLNASVWLGRGSFIPGLSQQWGLPVHYFCGFSIDASAGQRNMYSSGRSHSFCCGLADLPAGDLFLQLEQGKCSPWIDYRSDLWKHLRTPGKLSLGATFLWTVADSYYHAIASYYESLVRAGIVRRKTMSAKKQETALTPQFCTWGVQVERHREGKLLDQGFLESVYSELKASGMKAGLFSIDDKWEGTYGNLTHSSERFPHFEQFLDRLRADGFRIGMWAALMRCERPEDIGLKEDQMLKLPNGTPYRADFGGSRYYILDFTRPEVASVVADLARQFIRRYKPDLLKFDFGYELPAMSEACPSDMQWAGERLMLKGLQVAITAMREEKPDLVVMYYNLSPLLFEYFDLHSPDDLYMCAGEYDVEANRRMYFSSLLGRLGIPTYGSTGYDWASAPEIWFDSAAVGTIGSLNDFQGDEQGESVDSNRVARYNGIARALRSTTTFEVVPFGTIEEAPTLGAHARSWARIEGGELVLLAYRPPTPGSANPLLQKPTGNVEIDGAVESDAPLLITSQTAEGIARSGHLAVVPCGKGVISIRRKAGHSAEIRRHYLGGEVVLERVSVTGGYLKITNHETSKPDHPLEWVEVHIS